TQSCSVGKICNRKRVAQAVRIACERGRKCSTLGSTQRGGHVMMGGYRVRSFNSRISPRGASKVEFLDIVTAIVVLAILVYAASRQFPAYRNVTASTPGQSQAH